MEECVHMTHLTLLPAKVNKDIINVRENWRGNQRNWQHWVHKTQEEDKQNKKHNTENWNDEQHRPNQGPAKGNQFLTLIRHPPCYS